MQADARAKFADVSEIDGKVRDALHSNLYFLL
jgi:hypothetical protein